MEDDIEGEVVLHHASFIFKKKNKVVKQEANFLVINGEVVYVDGDFILSFFLNNKLYKLK